MLGTPQEMIDEERNYLDSLKTEPTKKIICWWSGGVTSAVACKLAIDLFGKDKCQVIMIDTKNEDDDTYRFKNDCEKWYGLPITSITAIGTKYESIQDVWIKKLSLNTATGAICSTELKRWVREEWQRNNEYDYQIFGYEFESKEFNRAKGMYYNNPTAKAIFPLLMFGYDKPKCGEIVQFEAGIQLPVSYYLGFKNNNCLKTGCVQGGIGYWQLMREKKPDVFNEMARIEHLITDLKGEPVTMLKDQTNEGKKKAKKDALIFLIKHPKYPDMLCIDDKPKQKVEPLFECNGFCGTNDLNERSKTEKEINYGTII